MHTELIEALYFKKCQISEHFPVNCLFRGISYLKQLIHFQFFRTEHDAVGITSNSDGLAALTEQHHVLTMFTVEPMGNACYYTHTQKKKKYGEGTLSTTDL